MISPDRPTKMGSHSSNLFAVGRRGQDYEGFFILLGWSWIQRKYVPSWFDEDTKYQVDASEAEASAYVTKQRIHSEFVSNIKELLEQPKWKVPECWGGSLFW